jgi:hypothetical protein
VARVDGGKEENLKTICSSGTWLMEINVLNRNSDFRLETDAGGN